MIIAYASRTGNVESIVHQLNQDTFPIVTGTEKINENFILFTYTDGYGDIPAEVENFLTDNHSYLKGVIVSGDPGYGDAYCRAGDKIAKLYAIPCLYKVENAGTQQDITNIKQILADQ